MKLQRRDAPSMGLFIAAATLFAAFHFVPVTSDEAHGWELWSELSWFLRDPANIDPAGGIMAASFLTFSLLIPSSPFLIGIWRKSRLAWWLAVVFSGVSAFGFFVMILISGGDLEEFRVGGWCLIASPFLTFAGLLAVTSGTKRRRKP